MISQHFILQRSYVIEAVFSFGFGCYFIKKTKDLIDDGGRIISEIFGEYHCCYQFLIQLLARVNFLLPLPEVFIASWPVTKVWPDDVHRTYRIRGNYVYEVLPISGYRNFIYSFILL